MTAATMTTKQKLRARIFYDHSKREIVLSDPETKAEISRRSVGESLELTNVKVVIEQGTRVGCADTGLLGFVVGDVSDEAGAEGSHMLRWCGFDFEAHKKGEKPVVLKNDDKLARVVVLNVAMTADL